MNNNIRHLMLSAGLVTTLVGCSVELPPVPAERQNLWADQGWRDTERHWFHHAPQGTNTFGLPYEWFVALEQPTFSLSEVGLFSDQAYLSRMGFIPSPASLDNKTQAADYGYKGDTAASRYAGKDYNAANLPVGFAVSDEWFDPASGRLWPIPGTGKNARSMGLTCAACHTGQLEYGDHRILIDGGAGMISLDKFRDALKLSLAFTKVLPGRFDRFAKRVLGDQATEQNRSLLKQQFDEFLKVAKAQGDLEDEAIKQGRQEGFTRLDALNRIGNEVFSRQMNLEANMYPTSGPVSYPFIWNAPWFDWVQYNSSIQQPMVRNAGEAMGVKAAVNLTNPEKSLFASHIPISSIHEMETLLGGEESPLEARRFGGLRSPKWQDLPLPSLNPGLVVAGRDLYLGNAAKGQPALCAGCHLPPIDSPQIFDARYWAEPGPGFTQKYLALKTIPVTEVGTDCKTAFEMVYRTVQTPAFIGNSGAQVPPFPPQQVPKDCPQPKDGSKSDQGATITNFGVALGEVVEKTKEALYDAQQIPQGERAKWDGNRPNGIRAVIDGVPRYKARPLNGVWATAPYLHNGSVPTLYLLLSTQDERDREARGFYLGDRGFDPKYVGFRYRADLSSDYPDLVRLADTEGLFWMDTALPGNRNTGHLFTDEQVAGRIGPKLSPEQRLALIEFLKSL